MRGNDFADRRFDAGVERTRGRPLASGEIKPWEALAVAAALALAAWSSCCSSTGSPSIFVPGARGRGRLSFLKRWFWMPQAWLGVAFGFGIPMAFAAQVGNVSAARLGAPRRERPLTIAYDTEYAMVDRDDDRRIGLKTSAILFGRHDVTAVMALLRGLPRGDERDRRMAAVRRLLFRRPRRGRRHRDLTTTG
jgi:4-hydroxybenzoate polyprenyltransferase